MFIKLSLAARQLGKRDDGGGEKDVESEWLSSSRQEGSFLQMDLCNTSYNLLDKSNGYQKRLFRFSSRFCQTGK